MSRPLSVVLCGAGGFGEWYLSPLLAEGARQGFRFVAVVDPHPERCGRLAELRAASIPVFPDLESFYAASTCDLVILCSPIHLHCRQTCFALARGSHVLCEKPLCVGTAQIALMEEAERASGKTVTVGYQWSFSPAVRRFKEDYLAGRFGAAKRFRSLVCWPRGEGYYGRNGWAGRKHLATGEAILDSPVNNAAAHYLHNMFYVLGRETGLSSRPLRVEAELWRVHPIENYDTAALRIELGGGIDAFFYASHATREAREPAFLYEFENGTASYRDQGHGGESSRIVMTYNDGRTVDYGSPEGTPYQKIWDALAAVRSGLPPRCGISAAKAHALCVEMAQEAGGEVREFPDEVRRLDLAGPSPRPYVAGLGEILEQCYDRCDPLGGRLGEALHADSVPVPASGPDALLV